MNIWGGGQTWLTRQEKATNMIKNIRGGEGVHTKKRQTWLGTQGGASVCTKKKMNMIKSTKGRHEQKKVTNMIKSTKGGGVCKKRRRT
jgi:hypothetical protein